MKSSGNPQPRGYGEGMHARLCRNIATGVALAKLNYVRVFKLVELYQPMLVPEQYEKYVASKAGAARSDLSRYQYVADVVAAGHENRGHLDVGCQFGAICVLLDRCGIASTGIEYQYFSYLAAKELAYLNGARFTQIINADVTKILDRVPAVESITMLSILHHIAQLLDDEVRYRAFLETMLAKAMRLIVLELASPDEGKFVWSEPNRRLCAGRDVLEWHTDFLQSHGFVIANEPRYFPTHLGGSRPIVVAHRRS